MNFDRRYSSRLPLDFALRQAATCSAKGGSEVAYQINLVWRRFGLDLDNAIVNVFEVPVIQKSHHDAQTVEFAATGKRVFLPMPRADFFLVVEIALRAEHRASCRHDQFSRDLEAIALARRRP